MESSYFVVSAVAHDSKELRCTTCWHIINSSFLCQQNWYLVSIIFCHWVISAQNENSVIIYSLSYHSKTGITFLTFYNSAFSIKWKHILTSGSHVPKITKVVHMTCAHYWKACEVIRKKHFRWCQPFISFFFFFFGAWLFLVTVSFHCIKNSSVDILLNISIW